MSSQETALHSPIGLIAGNGRFPLEYVDSARARGLDVVVIAQKGETDPIIEERAKATYWIKVGQVGKALRYLKREGVRELAFVGGISRAKVFRTLQPDFRGIRLLWRLGGTLRDDVILRGLAGEAEKDGFVVISPAELLPESLVTRGLIAGPKLSEAIVKDAALGWEVAKMSGSFDVGQTVVVHKGIVTAVEAVEGTDAAILRSGELAGEGGVVVKVAKPQQDLRLDLPAVGVKTITNMARVGAVALVLESKKALLLDPQGVVNAANEANISIFVADSLDDLAVGPKESKANAVS